MRTAFLHMVPDYPEGSILELGGYTDIRMLSDYVMFFMEDGSHLYFKHENILEIKTIKGKM